MARGGRGRGGTTIAARCPVAGVARAAGRGEGGRTLDPVAGSDADVIADPRMRCARPGEEALQEGTPADARAVRSEGFEILRKAARAQSVVADRHRRRSNAAGAREAVGFAVERDIGIDPRHQRREIDREIAREAKNGRATCRERWSQYV